MNNILRHIVLTLCAFALLAACEPNVPYSHYEHIGSEGWGRKDTLRFESDTLRHDGAYGFVCGVRTQREYPYQNLVLLVDRKVYRDSILFLHKREKVTCPIVTKRGKSLGDGIASKQHEAVLEDMELKSGDSLAVMIYHQMADEALPGIIDVGFIMERR